MKKLLQKSYEILKNGDRRYLCSMEEFEAGLTAYLAEKVGMPVLYSLHRDCETKSLYLCIDEHYEGGKDLSEYLPYLDSKDGCPKFEDDWELGTALLKKIQDCFHSNTCEHHEILREILGDAFGFYAVAYGFKDNQVEIIGTPHPRYW